MRISRGRSPKIEGTAGGGLSPVGRLTCLFRWSCEARLIPCIQIGEKLFLEFPKAQLVVSVQDAAATPAELQQQAEAAQEGSE